MIASAVDAPTHAHVQLDLTIARRLCSCGEKSRWAAATSCCRAILRTDARASATSCWYGTAPKHSVSLGRGIEAKQLRQPIHRWQKDGTIVWLAPVRLQRLKRPAGFHHLILPSAFIRPTVGTGGLTSRFLQRLDPLSSIYMLRLAGSRSRLRRTIGYHICRSLPLHERESGAQNSSIFV